MRLTGPGKIQELTIPSAPPDTFAARLFNFDIDGDVLKPQHKAWLAEHVVPQLGNPKVIIQLDGEASRSGTGPKDDDTRNLALSRRRVANVMSFDVVQCAFRS
jgi:outer membrane protein OmpA-like peptidoglycan-associated protein